MSVALEMLPIHPAADIFPPMDAERLGELTASIREHGQIVPIVLFEGAILDGRNRYRACRALEIEPMLITVEDVNPFEYVWILNGQRRDMDPGQRTCVRILVERASAEWLSAQEQRHREANRKRSTAAGARRQPDGTLGACGVSPDTRQAAQAGVPKAEARERGVSPDTRRSTEDWERVALAERANVSPATAARALALEAKRPDLVDAVAQGRVKFTEALRQAKRAEVATQVAALPAGVYRVLYADPPWKYGDERAFEQLDASAAAGHYPTMSVEVYALAEKCRRAGLVTAADALTSDDWLDSVLRHKQVLSRCLDDAWERLNP